MFIISPEDEDWLVIPSTLSGENFDGLFIGGEINDSYLFALRNLDVPMVGIDFYIPEIDMDYVFADNFHAGYVATAHLIQRGHKKIGFIKNEIKTSSVTDRYFGYLKALNRYGLECSDEWYFALRDIERFDGALPTAFVCHNDIAALSLIQILKNRGLSVPGEICTVSFDNLILEEENPIALTTMDIDIKLLAEKAFDRLVGRIDDRNAPYKRVTIGAVLIEKGTVKNLNKEIESDH